VVAAPATGAVWQGGQLLLNNSTLTAYRGCDVSSPGTDASTWNGVVVSGNPANPEVAYTGYHPQGQVTMNNSTLSYAYRGIQNGSDISSSGGVILTGGTTNNFYNNVESIHLWPYTYAPSLIEINNCRFLTDALAWFVPADNISMNGITNVSLFSDQFIDTMGTRILYAISCIDASATLQGCKFDNYNTAVNFQDPTTAHTIHALLNTFNNNIVGINGYAAFAPSIAFNTFNIPPYSGPGFVTYPYYPGTHVLMLNDQSIGASMMSTTGYIIENNIFQTSASHTFYPYTTGTLEYNTGGDNNQVTGNSFTGLGAAMLSNFTNNNTTTNTGLQYLCNSNAYNSIDLAAAGYYSMIGGICQIQGTSSSGTPVYDRPAGNNFSSPAINLYNQQQWFVYNYQAPALTSNPQFPAFTYASSGTLVIPSSIASPAVCYPFADLSGPYTLSGTSFSSSVSSGSVAYGLAAANVNYYLTDTSGILHRDSLYYWAGQMNTAYGALLTSLLLIEDSLIDSANTVYNGILGTYPVDSIEENEFTEGRHLMDLIISKRQGDRNIYRLTPEQVATLQSVKENTTMWAHARSEGWLMAFEGDTYNDTLLFPIADTTVSDGDGGRNSSLNHHGISAAATSLASNRVFPNPVHDILDVFYTAESSDEITLIIEDISGRTVLTQALQSALPNTIDMRDLVAGMYIYKIMEGNNVTIIGKVAKE